MSSRKAKLYKISANEPRDNKVLITFFVGILVYALVLEISSSIFRGIYIENFCYAVIAALILTLLNYYLKPFIQAITLPLNIVTLGLSYPIVNVIILYLCDIIMGKSFELGGFISVFIIAIFIGGLKLLFDNLITKKFY